MLSYIGFKSLRSLSEVLNAFSTALITYSVKNGWQSEKKDKADNFDTCAHVFNIVWKARKIELEGAKLGNFMLK